MAPAKLTVYCAALAACILLAAGAAAQPSTQTSTTKGVGTVSTEQIKGEVVEVEGNGLLVRLASGDLKTFNVPEARKFLIDGKELSVHDLKPGTSLTATVKTTTTPVTVRTRAVQNGKVWFVSAPTVILTLPNGENKQYVVGDDVTFTLNGKPATVFQLKKGMVVSAQKIVEAPDVEITTATTVVGQAPAAPAAALPATAPAPAAPAAPARSGAAAGGGTAAGTASAGAPAPAPAPEAAAPAATAQPAPPAQPAPAQPAAPEIAGGTNWMLWGGLLVLVIIVFFVYRSTKSA